MKLDIIIPVYNEDENIIKLIKKMETEIISNFRILICYDSESDRTLSHLKDKNILSKEILYIKNPGQGPNSAIIEGIKSSKSKIILVYMADDFENVNHFEHFDKFGTLKDKFEHFEHFEIIKHCLYILV